jgi:hypothetical protein
MTGKTVTVTLTALVQEVVEGKVSVQLVADVTENDLQYRGETAEFYG